MTERARTTDPALKKLAEEVLAGQRQELAESQRTASR